MTAPDPQMIGPYRLGELLGAGALGQVFRAQHAQSGRVAALRLLRADLAAAPGFDDRLRALSQLAGPLRHPHIAALYEVGRQGPRAFIAVELLPDGSLSDLLRPARDVGLSLRLAIDLARQAAEALAYAHAQGCVHGALEPSAMLLRQAGAGYTLKLADFGVAGLTEPGAAQTTAAPAGPPDYLAPEQCQGLEPIPASDVYALGVALFEMTTGALPFVSHTLSEAIANQLYTPPPSPRARRTDIAPELDALIMRCLAKQPDQRGSAAELADALRALLPATQFGVAAEPATELGMPAVSPAIEPATELGMPAVSPAIEPATELGMPAVSPASEPATELGMPAVSPASEPATQLDMPAVSPAIEPATELGMPAVSPASEPATQLDMPVGQPKVTKPATQLEPTAQAAEPAAQLEVPAGPVATPPQAAATPSLPSLTTQTLIIGTPPPGFPTLPAPAAIPQVQVLDRAGQAVQLASLTGDGLAIGRLPDNELALDAPGVSDRHAQLDWNGSTVSVTDLGSKNGSLLGGARLHAHIATPWPGDAPLQIGPFWLRLVPALPRPTVESEIMPVTPTPPPRRVTPLPTPVSLAPLPPQNAEQDIRSRGPVLQVDDDLPPLRPPPEDAALGDTDRIGVVLEQPTLTLTPGQSSVVRMTISNIGTIVDHVTLSVVGVPESWVQGPPQDPQLAPGDHHPASLTITPPREPASRAGSYPVLVQARSHAVSKEAGKASAEWTVKPFEDTQLEIKPRRASGWRRGRYSAVLANGGNAPANYTLAGEDDEAAFDFQFARERVSIQPGDSEQVALTAARPLRIVGGAQPYSLTFRARGNEKAEPLIGSAQFIQRGLIPVWLPPLLLLLLVGLLWYLLRAPTIKTYQISPKDPVEGAPVTVYWEVANARVVELLGVQSTTPLTPTARSIYAHEFSDAASVPENARLVARSLLGRMAEATVQVSAATRTPVPTATPAPPPPTDTPAPPPPTDTPAPPPPTDTPAPPPPTAPPTATPTPLGPPCAPGAAIAIDGQGQPQAGYLVYFNGRAVTGGTIGRDGRFRAVLVIGQEAPGAYPVVIRLRDAPRNVLALFTYTVGADGTRSLRNDSGRPGVEQITCVVPEIKPSPTPTSGIVVYPPRTP